MKAHLETRDTQTYWEDRIRKDCKRGYYTLEVRLYDVNPDGEIRSAWTGIGVRKDMFQQALHGALGNAGESIFWHVKTWAYEDDSGSLGIY